jgi:uncharacterized protein
MLHDSRRERRDFPRHPKLAHLHEILKEMESVLIAFSGGVDSSFLLRVARDALGENTAALTALSPTYPEHELQAARQFAADLGVSHILVESNELKIENFAQNDTRRCYYCKSELFRILRKEADQRRIKTLCDGSNVDDMGDFRPGMQAAQEKGVRHPLIEAGLSKQEIRELSRELGLATYQKGPMACLSSRFPYGTEITEARVRQVARCEELLRAMGYDPFRVRYHGEIARIEIQRSHFDRLLRKDHLGRVMETFKKAGFVYVTLDLEGFRSGSMNEVLPLSQTSRKA